MVMVLKRSVQAEVVTMLRVGLKSHYSPVRHFPQLIQCKLVILPLGKIYAGTAETLDLTSWNENSNIIASRLGYLDSLWFKSTNFSAESFWVRAVKSERLLRTCRGRQSYPMPNWRSSFLPSAYVSVKTEVKLRRNLLVIILMAESRCVGKFLIIIGLSSKGWKTFEIIHWVPV